MYGDITKRHERMKRLPEVKFSDYFKPVMYAVVAVPVIYVLMFSYYVIANVMVGVI